MDEIKKFIYILRKYLLALIVVPILTVIVTYFLVRNMPDTYISQADMATGIVDETQQYQQQSLGQIGVLPNDQINQQFSNLMATMRIKKMLDQVSYTLILHDLTSEKPFRTPSGAVRDLNPSARAHAIAVYRELFAKKSALNLWDKDQNGIYNVLKSMHYDSESISDKLTIFRAGASDFITIQFQSEDPTLSAMVVNTLVQEFISYYSTLVRTNKIKATEFVGVLLKEKSDTLANKMAALKEYKIRNRVLNLDEQSKQLYTSINAYDAKKQEAVQNTSSYAGALNEIDRKFTPDERKYLESTISKINQDITGTKQELSAMYDHYYKSDFEDKYKVSIDSLELKLSYEIGQSSDQYISNPLAAKEALVQQKIDLQIKLDLYRYSINALEQQLSKLNNQFDQLVPREAEVQSYEMEINIATKEYIEILNKYNQSSLESTIPIKISMIQAGMPGLPQPSKKMLLVILSGIISSIFVFIALFVVFLMDRRILSGEQLANKTQLPVLGIIRKADESSIDLRQIWTDKDHSESILKLKNQLRSIRYEIENDLSGKILLISSLNADQGKTFLTLSLAFAWIKTGKRVLVIDGNFNNPNISNQVGTSLGYLEDYLTGLISIEQTQSDSSLSILKNRGGDSSLVEITSFEQIKIKLDQLRGFYDVILIESSALDVLNQSKEWSTFADGIIAVFNYGSTIFRKEKNALTYLKGTGLFLGWVFNKLPSN
ncbi:succinoglycan biosynthesis transport protein ExoP [Pedobacter sp. UYP24]